MIELNTIYNEDCRNTMKRIDDNSIDSIVTDPPYELGFMGKKWDSSGIAYDVKMWKECLRVLKPGGYLLAFGGTRTSHRMVCAIEDAGFEIRDSILWLYGSGFPKSLDIGKAVDKQGGNSLGWFIDYILKIADEKGISRKELTMLFPSKNGNPTGWLWNKQKTEGVTIKQFNTIKNFLNLPFKNIEETKREVIGKGRAGLTAGTITNFSGKKEFDLTKGSSEYEGWGTALKPAHEPICVARKPIAEKTVADNILKYGTGGINIDGCRIETHAKKWSEHKGGIFHLSKNNTAILKDNPKGRFPANIILDEFTAQELDEQTPDTGAFAKVKKGHNGKSKGIYHDYSQKGDDGDTFYDDKGGASRFFYIAKSDRSERNAGLHQFKEKPMIWSSGTQNPGSFQSENTNRSSQNFHPTIKPIKLIQYLQRLVTPKGGLTYDPFGGSGTSALSASNEGFNWILSELISEYCDIANKRIYNNNGLFNK